MSIIETIKRRGRPPVPSGPEKARPVLLKLDAARAELAATIEEYSLAALAEAVGDPDGASRLVVVKAQRGQLEQRVADLEAAHAAAVDSDQRMFAAQRAALYSAQISAVKRHLAKREEAARKLDKAIVEAVSAWKALYASGRAAERANPIGGRWPDFSRCDPKALGETVRKHIRRVGGVHPGARLSLDDAASWGFPGAEARGAGEHDRTGAGCPPLVDEIVRINAYVLDTLEGRRSSVALPRPAVVEQQHRVAPAAEERRNFTPDVAPSAAEPADDREPWDPAKHAPLEWAAKQRAAAIARGEPVPPVEDQPDAEEAEMLRRLAAMDAGS